MGYCRCPVNVITPSPSMSIIIPVCLSVCTSVDLSSNVGVGEEYLETSKFKFRHRMIFN